MSPWALALFAAPPCLPLAMSLINIITWSRGRVGARFEGSVSVLVPARNEAANIEACIRAIAASTHPVAEILVYDDQSTDRTGEIVDALEIDHLAKVSGTSVPAGWVGKPHACHQLARRARGDLLLFVDADTRLRPEAVERVVSLLEDQAAGVVTAVPHQEMQSWGERLLIPLLLLTYTSWFPLALVAKSRDPRLLAANGQLLAVRRDTYDRLGGFEAVGQEIVDDVAFCRHAKTRGERVVFADGTHIASCRMYRSFGALWKGFSKNIYEGIGGTLFALVFTIVLYAGIFVAPYVALVAALAGAPHLLVPAAIGVTANLLVRGLLVARYRHPRTGLLLHPFAVIGLLAMAVNSFWWSRRGRLEWAGRSYAARRDRLEAAS